MDTFCALMLFPKIWNKFEIKPEQISYLCFILLFKILFWFIGDDVPGVSKRIGCPKCDRTYKSKKHLHRHLRKIDCGNQDPISTDSQLPNFRCFMCPYKTFRNVFLHKHMRDVHGIDDYQTPFVSRWTSFLKKTFQFLRLLFKNNKDNTRWWCVFLCNLSISFVSGYSTRACVVELRVYYWRYSLVNWIGTFESDNLVSFYNLTNRWVTSPTFRL